MKLLLIYHLSTCLKNLVNIEAVFCLQRLLCHGGSVFGEPCNVIDVHMVHQLTPFLIYIVVFFMVQMNLKLADQYLPYLTQKLTPTKFCHCELLLSLVYRYVPGLSRFIPQTVRNGKN